MDVQVEVPCSDLDRALPFYTEGLGLKVAQIYPADSPQVAVLRGCGATLRLAPPAPAAPPRPPLRLRVLCPDPPAAAAALLRRGGAPVPALEDGAESVRAPDGAVVVLAPSAGRVRLPPLRSALVVSTLSGADWGTGRAGMQYRDLIPCRLGGRYIASHIRIPDGGPVPDYVHYHHVHFQLIYCLKGWVRVAYEGQGEPFVLRAGDCVNQPPAIRHRVLESSPGLEVLEVGCPAVHETNADPQMQLPTAGRTPERAWAGQRFVRHIAAAAQWRPSDEWDGVEMRDVGMAEATGGVARVRALRARPGAAADLLQAKQHGAELLLLFVAAGRLTLRLGTARRELREGDAAAVPPRTDYAIGGLSGDAELVEVALPAAVRLAKGAARL
eukprot:TRINITY_DN14941_c0_g2_i1.p1 TRINITY_DN14941_c0_g2~~TRINITY_DN14941_c0_g2_i1.p1  ORF type:complete len:385 (+),score=128.55 TRINITY_DN14941_c0_g2_i1:84-1238(+)